MMRTGHLVVACTLIGLAGCTVTPAPVYTPSVSTGTVTVSPPVASYPPMPPPRVERVPPRPAGERWAWVGGHWHWNGNRYAWVQGRYQERPVAATHWVPGHWENRPRGYVWVGGHWA